MVVIPIVWSLLLVGVIKDCLIWSAWFFCSITCRFETFLSPISLRLTIRWRICCHSVSMRNNRDLFNKRFRWLKRIIEVNRQNMRARNVIFPSNLYWSIFCRKDGRSWKVGVISVLSMSAIGIYGSLRIKSIWQELFVDLHHFNSILIHGDLSFRIEMLLKGNQNSRLTCDFSLEHERSKFDRV